MYGPIDIYREIQIIIESYMKTGRVGWGVKQRVIYSPRQKNSFPEGVPYVRILLRALALRDTNKSILGKLYFFFPTMAVSPPSRSDPPPRSGPPKAWAEAWGKWRSLRSLHQSEAIAKAQRRRLPNNDCTVESRSVLALRTSKFNAVA